MTMAMTIATTMRIPHSSAARFALRWAPRPDGTSGCPDDPPPPEPLPDGGGAAPDGGSTRVGVSTSSVTEDAPRRPSSQIRHADPYAGSQVSLRSSLRQTHADSLAVPYRARRRP